MKALTEFTTTFLDIFLIQTKCVIATFRYLHWFSRQKRAVFPSLQRIADAIGFCKRQVQRAIDKLIKLGWLSKIYRHRHSCVYFVPEELKKLDISDKKIFEINLQDYPDLSSKCPANVHPSIKSSSSVKSLSDGDGNDSRNVLEDSEKASEKVVIPHCIKIAGLTDNEKYIIAKTFSVHEIEESVYFAKKLVSAKQKIYNLAGFLIATCKRVRKKQRGF